MGTYSKVTVNNGFVRGTQAGASVTIGASVKLTVRMQVQAKTVSDVYTQISKVKSKFSADTWEKIEQSHVGGGLSFFFGLFDLVALTTTIKKRVPTFKKVRQLKQFLRLFMMLILQM